ncbi:MAG: FtsW/RodA/SpoVE family cell cycle protein, partial [Clostridia bacterium]|nr:FtsW/RodA/SpoVE family cell cycle protein [Clostridia bacterium]
MDYSYEEIMAYVDLYFTTGVRWVCMGLAVLVLLHQIFGLLKMRNPSEIWAYLHCPDGSSVPLTHWENLVGRHRGCDIILNLKSVSRSHGTLIRDSAGVWEYNDLNSKNGSFINGQKVTEPTVMKGGDVLTIGGCDFELYPLSLRERMEHIEKRKMNTKRTSPWLSMLAITVFQILTVMQFHISLGDEFPSQLPFAFALLCILMWVYVIALRMMKRTGFEVEIIAFFLSTLSLALTASAYPGSVMKQSFCVLLGVIFFFAMCWLLRDLNRAKKLIYIFMAISVVLLILNLALGTAKFGSTNWIEIGGFSFQPSELVKIVFIFVGAASLDELQQRRNLLIFLGFSAFCLCCLAVMGDFGTAIVFFATFLIISFLRSGDFTKMFLVLGGAALMGLMVLRFKPYVADRFEIWRHVWDDPTGAGYQQVQTMTSIASGGIPGLGAGEGNLSDVGAASTDLVFGMLSEEWGLVIAILAVLCIITLAVFAWRSIIAGRSTYYCIAACATTTMFMFQTILNVFGSIDLLPLTGVTFPFVSSGGTSMIASWGMLAFLKAADTRQNASIAVRSKELHPEEDLYDESLSAAEYEDAQQFFDDLEQDTQYQDYIEPEPYVEPEPAPRTHINVAPEPAWDRPEVPSSETPARREFA